MKSISKQQKSSIGTLCSNVANRAAYGRVVSSRFFKKYLFQVTFAVGLALVYISNRYDCVTGMETIAALQSELDIVRTELQSQRSTYMSSTRESAMQTLVDNLRLGLGIQERPPYQINASDNAND